MAINVDRLRQGLQEYHSGLNRHVGQLEHDFENIEGRFMALSREYEGQAAEEFRNAWSQTASWFRDYINQTRQLSDVLEERTRALNPL